MLVYHYEAKDAMRYKDLQFTITGHSSFSEISVWREDTPSHPQLLPDHLFSVVWGLCDSLSGTQLVPMCLKGSLNPPLNPLYYVVFWKLAGMYLYDYLLVASYSLTVPLI